MNIFQLVGIGVTGALISVLLKKYSPEIAICTSIATCLFILTYVFGIFENVVEMIEDIIESSGLDKKYFSVIIKIIGISYITEIASQLCKDAGEGAVSTKLELAGKLIILMLAMPIIAGFLEVCTNAVSII